MTTPQQGSGFSGTDTGLKQAQHEFDVAAEEVLREFKELEAAVRENRSQGDAFTKAQDVALALRGQADKFVAYAADLARKIGVVRKGYAEVEETGSEQIGSVASMIQGGAEGSVVQGGDTFNRLVPGSRT